MITFLAYSGSFFWCVILFTAVFMWLITPAHSSMGPPLTMIWVAGIGAIALCHFLVFLKYALQ